VPDAHDAQAPLLLLPGKVRKVPAWQSWQVLFPTAPSWVEYVPIPHRIQFWELEARIPVEYVPAEQLAQTELPAVAPETVLYLPAPQLVHWVPPVPVKYVPAPQERQATDEDAPVTVRKVPAGQARQAVTPRAVLYVPVEQTEHALRPTPEEKDPAPHWVPTLDFQAPTAVLNVPCVQSMHETVPLAQQMP
jgi:hypothetical protein